MGFIGPTEVVPLLQSQPEASFSAGCEVVPFQNAIDEVGAS
jgi:hypothetical protein